MSRVIDAAEEYLDALLDCREARNRFDETLLNAKERGRTAPDLADELNSEVPWTDFGLSGAGVEWTRQAIQQRWRRARERRTEIELGVLGACPRASGVGAGVSAPQGGRGTMT